MCIYKNECPSYSGWCEGPKKDFSTCVEFLINAYERTQNELKKSIRFCTVDGRPGYFHAWEHYSEPIEPGVRSGIFGIVEFSDGVKRVDPTAIRFRDDMNSELVKEENI